MHCIEDKAPSYIFFFSYISRLETSWVSHDLESDSSYSWLLSQLAKGWAQPLQSWNFCHYFATSATQSLFCTPTCTEPGTLHIRSLQTTLHWNLYSTLKILQVTFFAKLIFDLENKLCQYTLYVNITIKNVCLFFSYFPKDAKNGTTKYTFSSKYALPHRNK